MAESKLLLFAPAAALLVTAAAALAQDEAPRGPATIRITGEGVVAQFTFEKNVKLSVTSKPVAVKPGEHRAKKLSLLRTDDKKRTWELRCTRLSEFEVLTIDPGQDKILMLGKTLTLLVEATPNKDVPGGLSVRAGIGGQGGDCYTPGAYLDGRTMTLPLVTVKDADGRTVGSGRLAPNADGTTRFDVRFPAGYKGTYDVEIEPVLGPFEVKVSKTLRPLT